MKAVMNYFYDEDENLKDMEYGSAFVEQSKQNQVTWLRGFARWMIRLLGCVMFLLVFQLLFINAEIPSESMEQTIMTGDRIFGWKYAYSGDKKPERYDVIIFEDITGNGKYLIKRVIGLPGETLIFKDGYVYLEGQAEPLDDSFCMQQGVTTQGNLPGDTVSIPEGCYFVLGDNRLDSLDSRYWVNGRGASVPYVPEDYILAKAVFRYFPVLKMGTIK